MQAIWPNGSHPEPMRKIDGPISTTAPTKPKVTPTRFRVLSFSSVNICANGKTKSGRAAIEMPANADGTYCCPQLKSANGNAVFSRPMTIRYFHIRPSKLGKGRLSARMSTNNAAAPKVVRAQATVSGP